MKNDWRAEARHEFAKVWLTDPVVSVVFFPISLFISAFLAMGWIACWVCERVEQNLAG